jgi:Lar family restriction alleviation protein
MSQIPTTEPPVPSLVAPCPFCGSDDVHAWVSRMFGGWAIECSGCEMVFIPQHAHDDQREAVAAWNRRAESNV